MSSTLPLAVAQQSHTALFMFMAFVAATLVITYFSARKSSGSAGYFAPGDASRAGKTASPSPVTT